MEKVKNLLARIQCWCFCCDVVFSSNPHKYAECKNCKSNFRMMMVNGVWRLVKLKKKQS